MRYELNQSVRLIYAERTATVMGIQPPSTYVVHTDDGHVWDVGEDELGPMSPSAATAVQAHPHSHQRPADPYRAFNRQPRGAGWALGFMPLAMLVAQYLITFALAKPLRATELHTGAATSPISGLAAGGAFELLGLAFTVIGLMIVYNGTQDIGLTLGYFVVRWIEGYLLTFIFTAAVLTSLGLHPSPSGIGATPNTSSAQSVGVPNAQGIDLRINHNVLSIAIPGRITVNGKLVTTAGSAVNLRCSSVGGQSFTLAPQTPKPGPGLVAWRLGSNQNGILSCNGAVTLAHGGVAGLHGQARIYGFNLLPWTLNQH